MADGKKSFVLYCDMIHTVDLLEDALAGKLLKHLLRYVNDENPETDDLLLKIAFEPLKRQLKRDLKDWEDTRSERVKSGRKGGINSGKSRKKKQNKPNEANASKTKQTQANEAVSVNVNVTDTVNVNGDIHKNNDFGIIGGVGMWAGIKKKWGQDFRWKEKVCDEKKISMPEMHKKMIEFIADIELKEDYKNIPGLKKHFINWINKHSNGSTTHRQSTATNGKRSTKSTGAENLINDIKNDLNATGKQGY